MGITQLNTSIRSNEYSSIKGVLTVLVVVGHFLQLFVEITPPAISEFLEGSILFIYSFHMPLFVFISGYFSKNLSKNENNGFEKLLIPYLAYNLIFGIYVSLAQGKFSAFDSVLDPAFASWYLLALYIWRKTLRDAIRIKAISIIAVFLFFIQPFLIRINTFLALERVVGLFVFFLAGYYMDEKRFLKWAYAIPKPVAATALLAELLIMWLLSQKGYYGTIFSAFTFKLRSAGDNVIYVIVLKTIAGCCSAINCLLVVNLIRKVKCHSINIVGNNTIPMYLGHALIYSFTNEKIAIIPNKITACITAFATMLFCIWFFSRNVIIECYSKIENLVSTGIMKQN